ncbi:MAG: hypothetical protein IKD08_04770 [Alphaproteobacteria bacterium]|nr:hypothetical protein [Alphaproteobacteria bacterium]
MSQSADNVVIEKVFSCGCTSECGDNCSCGNGWWATFVFPAQDKVSSGVRSPLDNAIDIFSTRQLEKQTLQDGKVEIKVFLSKDRDTAEEYLKEYKKAVSAHIKLAKRPKLVFEPRKDDDFVLCKGEYLSKVFIEDVLNAPKSFEHTVWGYARVDTQRRLEIKYGENYTGKSLFSKFMKIKEKS